MFNLKEIISSIADVGQKLFKKKELKKALNIKKYLNFIKVKKAKNIEVLSISNLMAEAIKRISNSTSVSDLFK